MPVYFRATDLPVSAEDAFAWHARPGAFERLTAPWMKVDVLRRTGLIEPGAVLEMRMVQLGVPMRMVLIHEPLGEPGNLGFIDRQLEGPFASWMQKHRIVPTGPRSSRMEDEIHWEAPAATPIARMVGEPKLERMFRYRHRRLIADLGHHDAWRDSPRKTVAISGASGLVGGSLATFLTTGGHAVRRLVRGKAGPDDIAWDLEAGTLDIEALAGCDAVVHLAGAPISTRWTRRAKEEIRRSRVDGTALLARALAAMPADRRPKVFVSASAVGWYGSRGDEPLTEDSTGGSGFMFAAAAPSHPTSGDPSAPEGTAGAGLPDAAPRSSAVAGTFLAEVAEAWERAADPAREAGIRVVHPRIGIVMSGEGGALQPMAAATKMGVGGPVGGGDQYVSWVAIDDLTAILQTAVLDEGLSGPANATAPTPVPQRELAHALGRVLHRPSFVPLPGAVVRLASGEMGRELLLAGQRVVPRVLLDRGFPFAFTDIEDVLRHELGTDPVLP